MGGPGGIPPQLRGDAGVHRPDEGQPRWRNIPELSRDSSPADCVLSTAAIETMEARAIRASNPAAVCNIAASLTVPVRVCKENWYGRVVLSNSFAKELAIAPDMRRRSTSPATMPCNAPDSTLRLSKRRQAGQGERVQQVGRQGHTGPLVDSNSRELDAFRRAQACRFRQLRQTARLPRRAW